MAQLKLAASHSMIAAKPSLAYRGRFAPSPTGPLHLGSLVAAVASWLQARHAGGAWLLRIEDIDPPREPQGAAEAILHSLRSHGLDWDESILWQSQRSAAYDAALSALHANGYVFCCACSRRELGPQGDCQRGCHQRGVHQTATEEQLSALRVKVPSSFITTWLDPWQGRQHWPLGEMLSDFVVRRKDGLYAYQLAVVVDDAVQGITEVMRGADLLDSTPRQQLLQALLGYHTPHYAHLPVLADAQGHKLSKQNHAPPLTSSTPEQNLRVALAALGQASPPNTSQTVDAILAFALNHWSPAAVPAQAFVTHTLPA